MERGPFVSVKAARRVVCGVVRSRVSCLYAEWTAGRMKTGVLKVSGSCLLIEGMGDMERATNGLLPVRQLEGGNEEQRGHMMET